jgi:hypothetical protein
VQNAKAITKVVEPHKDMVNIPKPVVEVLSENTKNTATIVEDKAEKEKTTLTVNEV